MTLLGMLVVLVIPFGILTALSHLIHDLHMTARARARVGVSLLFLITGTMHFVKTVTIAAMIPPFIPNRLEVAYVTGAIEILAALALWIPRFTHLVGDGLLVYTICILPANIYAAMNHVDIGGHGHGPGYLAIRIPFQFLLMAWIYWSAIQDDLEAVRRIRRGCVSVNGSAGMRRSDIRTAGRGGRATGYMRAR